MTGHNLRRACAATLAMFFMVMLLLGSSGPQAAADTVMFDFRPTFRHVERTVLTEAAFHQEIHDLLEQHHRDGGLDIRVLIEEPGRGEMLADVAARELAGPLAEREVLVLIAPAARKVLIRAGGATGLDDERLTAIITRHMIPALVRAAPRRAIRTGLDQIMAPDTAPSSVPEARPNPAAYVAASLTALFAVFLPTVMRRRRPRQPRALGAR